jgi:hypothetical protein
VDDGALTPRAAQRLQRAAHAAQELSNALWDALRDELSDARPERVAALSERLVAIAGAVSVLAGDGGDRAAEHATVGVPGTDFPHPPRADAAAQRSTRRAVLVDELGADGEVEAYSVRARRRAPAGIEDLP